VVALLLRSFLSATNILFRLTRFPRAVLEGGEIPVPLEDAIKNMAVIEAIFRSAESGSGKRRRAGSAVEYLIGLILSVAVAGFATAIGLDRERAFYPTVLIVIASYYVLFAVIGGSSQALLVEIIVATGFLVFAVLGFKSSLWFAVAAIVGHGVLISSITGLLKTREYRFGGPVSV